MLTISNKETDKGRLGKIMTALAQIQAVPQNMKHKGGHIEQEETKKVPP